MDKKERHKDEKSRRRSPVRNSISISKRSHNLFHSIINLSPLGGGKSTSQHSPSEISPVSHNDPINMGKKDSNKADKKVPLTGRNTSGPGPRTVSILTALNELSIFDKVPPHPDQRNNTSNGGSDRRDNFLAFENQISTNSIHTTTSSSGTSNRGISVGDGSGGRRRITNCEATKQRNCRIKQVPHESKFFSSSLAFTNSSDSPRPQSSDQVGRGERRRKQEGDCGGDKSWSKSRLPLLPLPSQRVEVNHNNLPFQNERIKSERNTSKPPEWIQKIFQLTKCGRLDKLIQFLLLQELDSTVIRHFVDSKGRNLLHIAAGGGQLITLQWLLNTLGTLGDAALNDQDYAGHTPILKALKKKRLDCFKWMVLETGAGGVALFPPEERGEPSLLHYAARDGNVTVIRWLVGVLNEKEISVDLKNLSTGMTPLCEAASAGKSLVCHELIRNGANPLYQTEFGWKPMDFAIRQNQMECANYLMMAETAASVGTALHLRLKEFQALQEDHDCLRNHFRELLRVGKWLAKERTDLIKNSSSIGLKSAEAFQLLLLGESGSGTRFSDMEHKLGQAEQASKQLLSEKNASSTFSNRNSATTIAPLIDNGNPFNLLRMIAAAEERKETMKLDEHYPIPTENDDSSCSSSPPSWEDDLPVDKDTTPSGGLDTKFRQESWTTTQPQFKSPVSYSPKWEKSTIAPWLLPPSSTEPQFLYSQLSPLVRQFDLLETPPQSRTASMPLHNQNPSTVGVSTGLSLGRGGFLSHSSTVFNHEDDNICMDTEKDTHHSTEQPAVLQVIEPNLVSIKGTPDLIRETTRGDGGDSVKGLSKQGIGCGKLREKGIDDTIYSEITSLSTSSRLNRDSIPPSEFGPMSFSQSPIISNFSSNKCQNHQSCCEDTDVLSKEPGSPHPSSSSEPMYLDLGPSNNRNSVSNVDGVESEGKKSSSLSTSGSGNASCSTFHRPPHKNQQGQIYSSTFSGGLPLRNKNNNDKCNGRGRGAGPIDSSPNIIHTFPVQVSTQFPQHLQYHPNESQEDISCCENPAQVFILPESISTSNAPVLPRIFSSISYSSSTTHLVPSACSSSIGGEGENNKGKWELQSLMNLESPQRNMDGPDSPSPSPSEASRTESALALGPPPSNTSQGSHGSRTESAKEIPILDQHNDTMDLETEEKNDTDPSSCPENEKSESHRLDSRYDDEAGGRRILFGQSTQPPPLLEDLVQKNVVQDRIEGPIVSSRIHKASIHYVTKNGRRQKKAWYEMEGSDEEDERGESFLRNTESSPSPNTSHRLSVSVPQPECDTSHFEGQNCEDSV